MRKKNYKQYIYFPSATSAVERDYQLAQDVLRGDDCAWDTLYQESIHFLRKAVAKFDVYHFWNASDYEDIIDEAFAKCYEQLERYQGLSRFQKWVLGYAKNIMRNRSRTQLTAKKYQYLLERTIAEQSHYCNPLRILLHLERDQFLWHAFYQLDELDQKILSSRIFYDIAPRQLGKELNLTRKQVLERYETALFYLRWNFLSQYRQV